MSKRNAKMLRKALDNQDDATVCAHFKTEDAKFARWAAIATIRAYTDTEPPNVRRNAAEWLRIHGFSAPKAEALEVAG